MTPNNRHKIELFIHAQSLLHADENALTDETSFDDVKAIAQLCPDIREITRGFNNPKSSA
jgi:hypothetical protein